VAAERSEPKDVDFGPLWDGDATQPDEPGVNIPDVVRDAYQDEDKTMLWTAAGIGAAVLAGYGVKKFVQKRKGSE
jgi:hypothetical protein